MSNTEDKEQVHYVGDLLAEQRKQNKRILRRAYWHNYFAENWLAVIATLLALGNWIWDIVKSL